MRRPRPYIPLDVRVQVAERQASELLYAGISVEWWDAYNTSTSKANLGLRLQILLEKLSEALGDVLQLDHDPALELRQYKVDRRKPEAAWFTPNANDPDHLVYRVLGDHGHKTTGRKPGAEKTATTKGSDIWLINKFRRLERPGKKPKVKIPARAKPWQSRPFPKRKLPARK